MFRFCLFATFFQDLLLASLLVKNREQVQMLKDYARRLLKKSNMNSSKIVFVASAEKCVNHFTASRDLGEHGHYANKRI